VTVAFPVTAAVALARIEKPQRNVVLVAAAASVAVVAPVVPVAEVVIGVAPSGYNEDNLLGSGLALLTGSHSDAVGDASVHGADSEAACAGAKRPKPKVIASKARFMACVMPPPGA
jgi:hypothetical protein